MIQPRTVISLGATGSIGTQACDIIRRNPDRFTVIGLAATGRDLPELFRQIELLKPHRVAIVDTEAAQQVRECHPALSVIDGPESATELAGHPADVVLNGISGAAGLGPTIAALQAGSVLALANKESLIIGGPIVKRMAAPDQIVPVDSEHSALAQALRSGTAPEVSRLILTASGGPFRGRSRQELDSVTPEQALDHPTWNMGPLVTINSATLVNKGLELIEAHLLFDVALDHIDVVVHPQSVVHSMVEFTDGSTIAQASPPDMRLPIALGLGWPDRIPQAITGCDWTRACEWTFEPVDHDTFPAIGLAKAAAAAGGVLPAIFNAADEVAVAAFLSRDVSFRGIVEVVEQVIGAYDQHLDGNDLDVQTVLAADRWAREEAQATIRADTEAPR